MQQSKPKSAASLTKNDVLIEHPHSGRPGTWTIGAIGNECRVHVDLLITEVNGDGAETLTLASTHKLRVRATVEEVQHDCANALASITRRGLPPLTWSIDAYDVHLTGTFNARPNGPDPEAVAAAWGEWLEAEPQFFPGQRDGYLYFNGEYEGLRVTVLVYGITRPAEQKVEADA